MVGLLLMLACLPTLILNAGIGRVVLLHGHESTLHGHVLTASSHEHHHPHDDAVLQHGNRADADRPVAVDVLGDPFQGHCDGAVIRGAEVAAAKRQSAPEVAAAALFDLPPLSTLIASVAAPAVVVADHPSGGTGRTELLSLRVTILLI